LEDWKNRILEEWKEKGIFILKKRQNVFNPNNRNEIFKELLYSNYIYTFSLSLDFLLILVYSFNKYKLYTIIKMNLLTEIKTKNKKIKQILKNKQALNVFNDWLLTELAYTSNHIEGNSLTRRETEIVITQGLTSSSKKPFKDYQEAINHANAFKFILQLAKSNKEITQNDILNIHKEILKNINDDCAGCYRNVRVRIAGSAVILPNPLKVPDLMNEFIKFINSKNTDVIQQAIDAHFKFVSIHPFIDGNGRTARLLLNLLLSKNGYYPIIIRPRDRKNYLKTIEKGQLTGNLKPYNEFMFKTLNNSYQTVIDMFNNEADLERKNLLTISKFAKLAKVPVTTIRYHLKTGKLKPITKTENDYMLFSPAQAEIYKNSK